ncbi:MAG: DivIVA domain-containing protein [Clostridia bacterium]|nr:DivIVA domain-containing protein [Clostridia bacterium]
MITPLDIENKKFSKQMMNGYSVEDVDDFLDDLSVDYAKIYKELTEQKGRIEELEDALSKYRTIEGTLQNTLLMAQSTAEEVKNVAKQQADQIVAEAKSSIQDTVNKLNQEVAAKEQQKEELTKQFDVYKAKMESLLISQLELLKEVNKD